MRHYNKEQKKDKTKQTKKTECDVDSCSEISS